jgi:hypothetical protein
MNTQKYLAIRVAEPCHESWENMQPAEKGRFCDSCQKTVIDFTKMSDAELISFFEQLSQKSEADGVKPSICGHINQAQSGRLFALPNVEISHYQPSQWRKWAAIIALSTSLLGSASVQATNSVANIVSPQRYSHSQQPTWLSSTESEAKMSENELELLVVNQFTGTVFELEADNKAQPIANATVQLFIGNTAIAETRTNTAGEFVLQLPNSALFLASDKIKLHITADGYAGKFEPLSRQKIATPVRVFLAPAAKAREHNINGGISFEHYERYEKENKAVEKPSKGKE